jgi:hypothetical protein
VVSRVAKSVVSRYTTTDVGTLKSVISRVVKMVIRGISCSKDCNSWYLVL